MDIVAFLDEMPHDAISLFQFYPRRGYHNCLLSTVAVRKQQFISLPPRAGKNNEKSPDDSGGIIGGIFMSKEAGYLPEGSGRRAFFPEREAVLERVRDREASVKLPRFRV